MSKKTVLIVGGGFAGLSAATQLRGSNFNVVMLDPKSFFEMIPVAPHSLIVPAHAPRTLVDYPASLHPKQGLLVGLTTDGTKGRATLQGGEELEFDYCLLATGSTYPSGVKPSADRLTNRADRLKEFSVIGEKIAAAKTVVVVGGGSVGVETASEVAEAYPDKKVTLVSAGGLLERMDPKIQQYGAAWLKEHGVEVVLGDRISDWGGLGDGPPGPATLTTASGRIIEGDFVIKCVGVKPATEQFASSLGDGQLAPNGSIAVEPTLQVKGWPNVFACGDVSNTPEEKTAAYAGVAAVVAACNILALDAGKELKTYPEGTFGGFVPPMAGGFSLGTKVGAFQMGSDVQMGVGPAKIKGVIGWVYLRIAGGSRLWAWMYGGMRGIMVSGLTKEAQKAAATKAAAAAAVAAAEVTTPAVVPAAA